MTDHIDRSEAISAYFDGGLDDEARRDVEEHLASCSRCREALEELVRLRAQARELRDVAPLHDLWPTIVSTLSTTPLQLEARDRTGSEPDVRHSTIAPTHRMRVFSHGRELLIAAGIAVLAFAAGWSFSREQPDTGDDPTTSPRYALLLHEPAEPLAQTPQELARTVDEYRRWARATAQAGNPISGEKLADDEGFVVRVDRTDQRDAAENLCGFFIVEAKSYEQALAIARGCPHIAYGGWIEVRRIEET